MGEVVADFIKHMEAQRRTDQANSAEEPPEYCDCPACRALAVIKAIEALLDNHACDCQVCSTLKAEIRRHADLLLRSAQRCSEIADAGSGEDDPIWTTLSAVTMFVDQLVMSFGNIVQAAHAMDMQNRLNMAEMFAEILQGYGIDAAAVKVNEDGTVSTPDGTPFDGHEVDPSTWN